MYIVVYGKGIVKTREGNRIDGWLSKDMKSANKLAGELNAMYPSNRYTIYKLKKIKTLHYSAGKY